VALVAVMGALAGAVAPPTGTVASASD